MKENKKQGPTNTSCTHTFVSGIFFAMRQNERAQQEPKPRVLLPIHSLRRVIDDLIRSARFSLDSRFDAENKLLVIGIVVSLLLLAHYINLSIPLIIRDIPLTNNQHQEPPL